MVDEDVNPVLEYGNDAVQQPIEGVIQKPADDALGYGETAVELKQKKKDSTKKKGPGKPLIIIAGGFSGYSNIEDEIREIEESNNVRASTRWLPNTVDFEVTAVESDGIAYKKAGTPEQFFNTISLHEGYISRLVFIGHAGRDYLGLAGNTGGVGMFTESIGEDVLQDWEQFIKEKVRTKFADGAEFYIIACSVATSDILRCRLAEAFGIPVRAYESDVEWCITFQKEPPTIHSRGRLAPSLEVSRLEKIEDDMTVKPSCREKVWRRGIAKMIPPKRVTPGWCKEQGLLMGAFEIVTPE